MNEKQLQDAITKIVSKNFNKVVNNANSNIRTGKIVFVNLTEKKARVIIDGSAGYPTGYLQYPLIYSNVRVGDECVVVFTDATLLSGGKILSIYGNNSEAEQRSTRIPFLSNAFDNDGGLIGSWTIIPYLVYIDGDNTNTIETTLNFGIEFTKQPFVFPTLAGGGTTTATKIEDFTGEYGGGIGWSVGASDTTKTSSNITLGRQSGTFSSATRYACMVFVIGSIV